MLTQKRLPSEILYHGRNPLGNDFRKHSIVLDLLTFYGGIALAGYKQSKNFRLGLFNFDQEELITIS